MEMVLVQKAWLDALLMLAATGFIFSFVMFLWNLDTPNEFDDTDYPNEEDE